MLQPATIPIPLEFTEVYREASEIDQQRIAQILSQALKDVFSDTKTSQGQTSAYSDYKTEKEENEEWSRLGLASMAKETEDEPNLYSMDDVIKIPHNE